jgi:hypothetical protein
MRNEQKGVVVAWVTFELRRENRTQMFGEPRPPRYLCARSATPVEIELELEKRKRDAARKVAADAFNARPEVIAARAIKASLELGLEGIIDRLTPAEWASLRARLEGKGEGF